MAAFNKLPSDFSATTNLSMPVADPSPQPQTGNNTSAKVIVSVRGLLAGSRAVKFVP
jgi:hypothetical protein